MLRLHNSSSMIGEVGVDVKRDDIADMKREVTVLLGVEGSGLVVVVMARRARVGVMSAVEAPSSSCEDMLLNQPAKPPAFGLSTFVGLLSPVNGIVSWSLEAFLVGEGVLLRKAAGSRLGKECCRRWELAGL